MKHLPNHTEEIEWFVNQPTLAAAIAKAAMAENCHAKRYNHQVSNTLPNSTNGSSGTPRQGRHYSSLRII